MRFAAVMMAMVVACTPVAAAPAVPAKAPATPRSALPGGIVLGPGSVLWLNGKSNLHDFESRSTAVAVTLTRTPGTHMPTTPAQIEAVLRTSGVRTMDLTVPTKSLHSTKDGLDKNLWQDLRADRYPTVGFRVSHYTVAPNSAHSDTLAMSAQGTLTIRGQARPVTVTGRAYRTTGGVWLEGTHSMLMTDYGIKPRRMMLGSLRVKDQIAVHYRLFLVPGGQKTLATQAQP